MVGSHSLGSVVNDLLRASPLPVVLAPQGLRNSPVDRMTQITCALGTRPTPPCCSTSLSLRRRQPTSRCGSFRLSHWTNCRPASQCPMLKKGNMGARPPGTPYCARASAQGHRSQYRHRARAHRRDAVERLDWHDGDLLLVGSTGLRPRNGSSSAPPPQRCCASCRCRCRPSVGDGLEGTRPPRYKKDSKAPRGIPGALCKLCSAVSYSPTLVGVQYHWRWRA